MQVTNDKECRIYVDIITGKNCRQFSLLTWNSFIGQFVRGKRIKWWKGEIFILTRCFFYLIEELLSKLVRRLVLYLFLDPFISFYLFKISVGERIVRNLQEVSSILNIYKCIYKILKIVYGFERKNNDYNIKVKH